MSATCDRCLGGNHRCLTRGCACSCNGARTSARVTPTVGRTPLPSRPRPVERKAAKPSRGVRGMALSESEAAAIPGDVHALVQMLRRYQLTGELA